MPESAVLIAGAGPTGLVLALRLARAGVPVRIIDKALEPGTTSRALVVHARTLEFYRQMGIAELMVEHGVRFAVINLWVKSRKVGRVVLGEMGIGLSPYPFLVILPQDLHERLLIEQLKAVGVEVERGSELVEFQEEAGGVRVRVRDGHGKEETVIAAYLAGCDGARSRVREILGTGFPGGTYQHLFYVADVEASGPAVNQEAHVDIADVDFLAVFPLKDQEHARLIGIVAGDEGVGPGELTWGKVSGTLGNRLGMRVHRVNWFSTYHVHHRVANGFRRGRAFLLGDAAHIHSPVGGQGMNTGIGDAVNLSWKLADVLQGRAAPALLDTYEPERIAFARRLVATTDRGFAVSTSAGPVARFVRVRVIPHVLPLVFRLAAVRRFMFRTVSQIMIRYRDSRLSQGRAGRLHAGDRLPWVQLDGDVNGADNFTPLDGIHWQVHSYGDAPAEVIAACQRWRLPVRVMSWLPAMGKAGLVEGALYLVRPDGYLAYVDPNPTAARLEAYLKSRHLAVPDISD